VRDLIASLRAQLKRELEEIENKKREEERLRKLAEQRAREAEQRWIAELERLAGQEAVMQRNSRLFALLPFGAGEFPNGHGEWGWFFRGSEVLMGAASIVSGVVASGYAQYAGRSTDDQGQQINPQELGRNYDIAVFINRASFGAWAALTTWGIVQAEVRFVPE